MLSNKLTGSINYYINQTEDLLITKRLSPSAGYQNPILNVGKIRNNGVELEVNWTDKIKDFEYNVGFNFSTTKNKVVELADKGQALPATGLLYDTDHIPHTPKKANLSADSIYIVQMGFSKAMRKLKLGMPNTELLSSSTAKKNG